MGLGTTTIITRTAHRTQATEGMEGMEITVHRMEVIARVAAMVTAIAE